MAKINCCFSLLGKKKKSKVEAQLLKTSDLNKSFRTRKLRLEQTVKPFEGESDDFNGAVPVAVVVEKDSVDVKLNESRNLDDWVEIAYEGEDEHDENASMKRELSDFDLQGQAANSADKVTELDYSGSVGTKLDEFSVTKSDKDDGKSGELIHNGHVSDPGIGKAEFMDLPKLKRCCSNLETSRIPRKLVYPSDPASQYSRIVQGQHENSVIPGSPTSVVSYRSADRVILKKHSSSQVLPSRSRKLWWKLFLWSHRNLHKNRVSKPQPQEVNSTLKREGGYYSETLDPNRASPSSNMQSPGSYTEESFNKSQNEAGNNNKRWDVFHGGASDFWPKNQWVAFSLESTPYARVDEWVKDLETQPPAPDYDSDKFDIQADESICFPPSPENGRSPPRNTSLFARRPEVNLSEEILYANSVIQSLNTSSTVAHISGISLKVIPMLSQFASLRSVNLSNNSIVHITPGSLPKGLHTLNLSRNKISLIEGLRELSRLRVLDLSYNRISRIGQGLSNCTIIKELYLAGNKISEVEGLHRLLKLAVLDLSFNKITTTKALGQLVANYGSLQALNLLGNPILNNISDDQLRKAICSLLPKLVYMNKQSIKPQRAREILVDSVAKAALGAGSSRGPRRRSTRRAVSGSSFSSVNRMAGDSSRHKGKNKPKSRIHK